MTDEPAPRLRLLGSRVGQHGGQRGVFLHDPLGVARDTHFLPLSAWRIAERLDGCTSCEAIAAALGRESDARLARADVAAVVDGLSRRRLLEDEIFERALEHELQLFKDARSRPAVGAGTDYEADPVELRIQLAGLVADDWDMPQLPRAAAVFVPRARIADARSLYARGYASIRHVRPTRIVLMASVGAPLGRLGVPLDMDLETPLGTARVDRAGLAALGLFGGRNSLAHRDDLALERQALFARLLFRDVPVVPLFVGALQGRAEATADPPSSPEVEEVVRALLRVHALPGATLFVCAASFGTLVAAGAASRRLSDSESIDRATRLDAQGFWRSAARAAPEWSAAELAAPYVLLRVLQELERGPAPAAAASADPEDVPDSAEQSAALRGSLLGYRQFATQGGSESAASVVFH